MVSVGHTFNKVGARARGADKKVSYFNNNKMINLSQEQKSQRNASKTI